MFQTLKAFDYRALAASNEGKAAACLLALVMVLALLFWRQRVAFKQGETAAENRILKGILHETQTGNQDTAIARDPGPHGL